MWYRISKQITAAKDGVGLGGLDYDVYRVLLNSARAHGLAESEPAYGTYTAENLEAIRAQSYDLIGAESQTHFSNDIPILEYNKVLSEGYAKKDSLYRQWLNTKQAVENDVTNYLTTRTDIFINKPPVFRFSEYEDSEIGPAMGFYRRDFSDKKYHVVALSARNIHNAQRCLSTLAHELSHAVENDRAMSGLPKQYVGHESRGMGKIPPGSDEKNVKFNQYMNRPAEVYARVPEVLHFLLYQLTQDYKHRVFYTPEEAQKKVSEARGQDFFNLLKKTPFEQFRAQYSDKNRKIFTQAVYNSIYNSDFITMLPQRIKEVIQEDWYGYNKYDGGLAAKKEDISSNQETTIYAEAAESLAYAVEAFANNLVDATYSSARDKITEELGDWRNEQQEFLEEEKQRVGAGKLPRDPKHWLGEKPTMNNLRGTLLSSFTDAHANFLRVLEQYNADYTNAKKDPFNKEIRSTAEASREKFNEAKSVLLQSKRLLTKNMDKTLPQLNEEIAKAWSEIGLDTQPPVIKLVLDFDRSSTEMGMLYFGKTDVIFDSSQRTILLGPYFLSEQRQHALIEPQLLQLMLQDHKKQSSSQQPEI